MKAPNPSRRGRSRTSGMLLAIGLVAAGCQGGEPPTTDEAIVAANEPAMAEVVRETPAELPLTVEPAAGAPGDRVSVTGEGLPAGAEISFEWVTWDGSYETKIIPTGVKFVGARHEERRVGLGTTTVDPDGRVSFDFVAPEDYGSMHDIYALVDGVPFARGGFAIRRQVTVTPQEGPVGTPITIRVEGLDRWPFGRALSVRYNNAYTGYISGVTNGGTGTAVIRASGPPGLHTIELSGMGLHGGGFLTNHQSPYARYYPDSGAYRFTFRVTDDPGGSEPVVAWPDEERVAELPDGAPFPTAAGVTTPDGVTYEVSPRLGPVGTPIEVHATGLRPGAVATIDWATVQGTGGGAAELGPDVIPLGEFRADDDGTLTAVVESPNHLGGWHAVQLKLEDDVVAERGFFMHRSLVSAPSQVRLGEQFDIVLQGGGLYDLDNGVAVTYNNAYIGYGCGATAGGPITLKLVASGTPGTHLVDIYPMVYRGVGGTGEDPWGFEMPQLNALEDHPGLDLGIRVPIIRLAIEVLPAEG